MLEEHDDNRPEHLEIVKTVRIGAGIIRQEEPEKTKDEILKCERQPVYIAPGCIIGDNAREYTSYENAEEQSRDYDRDGSCTPMGRSQVTDQRQHYESVNCRFHQPWTTISYSVVGSLSSTT